ncbi:trehalase family glycosidase [Rhodanobacter glycinis]|uniref:Alpha,alpha-trehalase n=1 Tax=Rhodanobacter glycinis TaxID=582702 RepID=A0A1I4DZ73_9GAMM|nr:trehalase family glycosidase [Rhodanobacter glycinis]SFK98918.1 alpha,alpha-trehalase [Rhodanobacter glycinis]
MKTLARTAFGTLAVLCMTSVFAATPDPARTRAYIDHAWTSLTRQMADCSAFGHGVGGVQPTVYLPHALPTPAGLAQLAGTCHVEVRRLPRTIHRLGDIDATKLPAQGLLYLPHPYVVPGGFFNAMYGWDSYFIELGLLADHREALARNMVDNALFEVAHYGGVLNANRTVYLSRSQPPFLAMMMAALMDDPASFPDTAAKHAWLVHAYPLAVRNHDVWTRPEHRAGDTGLARYFDYGHGPVPESRDARYYQGVIKWLLAHPSQDPGYLVKASQHPGAAESAHLKTTSCDVGASKVCADAWADGYRLSADYYLGDRAMRESGFDTDFHFGPFGGSTHHYAPVGLNSLLYRYECALHDFAVQLGKTADTRHWAHAAATRKAAMNQYLWQSAKGLYMDYDFVAHRPSTDPYLTAFYPLWADAASPAQAHALDGKLGLFEQRGGLAMSTRVTGAQWDAPFGWAPTNWLAVAGLDAYGFHADARRIAGKFTATVDRSFAADGTIREKYNMVLGNADVKITAGYTQNVIGFGWTNGVYLKMRQLLDDGAMPKATATTTGGSE